MGDTLRNSKVKIWHPVVDEIVRSNGEQVPVRPLPASLIHDLLKSHFFSDVSLSENAKSSRRTVGRANFPNTREVAGYLGHSKKFKKVDNSWTFVHKFSNKLTNFNAENMHNGYELRPIAWTTGSGYRDEIYPDNTQFRTYDEAIEEIRRLERETYAQELKKLEDEVKIYIFNINYLDPTPTPREPGHANNYWYPGYRWNNEISPRIRVDEEIPSLPPEILWSGLIDRNLINSYIALERNGLDAVGFYDSQDARYDGVEEGEEYNLYNYYIENVVEDRGNGGGANDGAFDGVYRYFKRYLPPEDAEDEFSRAWGRQAVELPLPTVEVIKEQLLSKIERFLTRQIEIRTSGIPISYEWELVDNQIMFELDPLYNKSTRWSEYYNNYAYKSSDAWDCLEEMVVETAQEYSQTMGYGGCAGPSATYFTYRGSGNYPRYIMPEILDSVIIEPNNEFSQFNAEDMYQDYEMRPIGWSPGEGYRDEASTEPIIYRTYDEAVDWIRNKERETYQDYLDKLLSSVKLLVSDVEYSGTIFEHEDYAFDNIPSEFGHDAYFWYPGYKFNPISREFDSEPVPDLPTEILIKIGTGDEGIGGYPSIEILLQELAILETQGVNGSFSIGLLPGETMDFNRYCEIRGYENNIDQVKEQIYEQINKAITDKIIYQTSGIPVDFKYEIVDNYIFFEENPQISRNHSDFYSGHIDEPYQDGKWQSAINEYTYKSSDDWDCTEEMNVDTGAEYRERMLYSGCAGESATYFTWSSGGNYPYYVIPVIINLEE